jgi:hypothetical protein
MWTHALAALVVLAPAPSDENTESVASAPDHTRVLVVTIGAPEADAAFADAVARAARFHGAALLAVPDVDDPALRVGLVAAAPEQALVFVPAERLDVRLHRRFLALARELDEDPFVDVEFGYLTGRDGAAIARLWERTERLHRFGLASTRWNSVFVASGMRSLRYTGHVSAEARAAGFGGDGLALGIVEADPDVRAFAARELPSLAGSAVVSITGNGDPQGIWLFDGARNLDPSRHVDYHPGRVGLDPDGSMPRLLARDVRALDLAGAIVWSGTCHSAVPIRALVEGDIVSTFGRTQGPIVHVLAPDESLCLAFLDAGVAALLAPIGANHGFAVDREEQFALTHGATLGAAIASTWDDVVLSAGGAPRLGDPLAGDDEDVMCAGGANRILIGDPTLRPFPRVAPRGAATRVEFAGERLVVRVDWDAGFQPLAWDMYGDDPERDWRVVARVELVTGTTPVAIAACAMSVVSGDGAPLPYVLGPCLVEHERGRSVLHLSARAPRALVSDRALSARFEVELAR